MNSSPSTSFSLLSLLSPSSSSFPTHRHRNHSPSLLITSSFPRRRLPHRRRRRLRRSPFTPQPPENDNDRDVSLFIDLESIPRRASSTLRRLLASGADALDDLRTSVYIDPGSRIVFSCRRSSVLFLMNLFFLGLAVAVAVRAVAVTVRAVSFLGFWRRLGFGDRRDVKTVRRDRSLGGREVVVGTGRRVPERGSGNGRDYPLLDVERIREGSGGKLGGKWMVKEGEDKKLPEWWPGPVSRWESLDGNEELKREADGLARGLLM